MAAGTLHPPGTDLGPCATPCTHKDCNETKLLAAEPCFYCREPIGYGLYYWLRAENRLAHAACYETHEARMKMTNRA